MGKGVKNEWREVRCKRHQVSIILQQWLTMPKGPLISMLGILGLRLVKKTINFDRPEVYHLYFGSETGQPGSVITFFPWPNQLKGRIGTGQVGVTSYTVPKGPLNFGKIDCISLELGLVLPYRFGERYLEFDDPDGLET